MVIERAADSRSPDGEGIDVLFIAANARSLVVNRGTLVRDMLRRGLRVGALVPHYEYSDDVLQLGIPVWKYRLSRHAVGLVTNISEAVELFRAIRAIRPAAVFAYSIKPIVYGAPAARLAGVRSIFCLVTGLGYMFSGKGWKRRIGRTIVRGLYACAGAVSSLFIFQNRDDCAELSRSWLFRRRTEMLVVGGSGVNLEEYPYIDSPAAPVTFIFMARLLREKGVLEYARAAEVVKARHPECRFLLLGGLDSSLQNAITDAEFAAIRRSGAVEVLGKQRDVRPYLQASSVFVLPSYYREGIPRSILEALSTGRAVITCDTPGCREAVVPGENGYLVPPRDSGALVEAMEEFVDNPALVARMGTASRRIAESHFDVRCVNNAMMTRIMAALASPVNRLPSPVRETSKAPSTVSRLLNRR